MSAEERALLVRALKLLRDIEWGAEPLTDKNECAWCLGERWRGHARGCHVRRVVRSRLAVELLKEDERG